MQYFEPTNTFLPNINNNEDLSMILPEANSSIFSDNNNNNNSKNILDDKNN